MTDPSEAPSATIDSLSRAVQRYFDLMYDWDLSQFDRVFSLTAQLHGLRNGEMRLLTTAAYREALARGPSPRSQKAPRQDEVLLIDIASATQALAKVRVRISAIVYLDCLSYHRIDGDWLITAKSFHVESEGA